MNSVPRTVENEVDTQIPSIIVQTLDEIETGTTTSDMVSISSSRQPNYLKNVILSNWVRKGLFRYCKFVTTQESLEYDQPLCLFTLEENNITCDKKKWWFDHKKEIVRTLNEKRGCVVESLKTIFKSKYVHIYCCHTFV